ncbi:MAG: MgtC/SapB family protein [Bacteroidetes bacterium]|nr:MgtC/SapB family protein [Bacteroidota bacterium]
MQDHWEMADVYKALLAVAAGIILGLEREMKDKVAGLKTITIICLGAALFGILSYKIGGTSNPTTIAAYVVSGVGFIGAGAIFKDGFTISGLTTAGIIWLAAAVGLSIGFGEYYVAATFIAASLIIIFVTPFINRLSGSRKLARQIWFILPAAQLDHKEQILADIRAADITVDVRKLTLKEEKMEVVVEVVLMEEKIKWLQEYFVSRKDVIAFTC